MPENEIQQFQCTINNFISMKKLEIERLSDSGYELCNVASNDEACKMYVAYLLCVF
jgi:hypothetical protein